MGYEFHVSSAKVEKSKVTIKIENRGVAPFYADWPIEWAVLDAKTGKMLRTLEGSSRLSGILPGESAAERSILVKVNEILAGQCLAIRVPNAMKNGLPVRFANKAQDQHASGWLTLPIRG